MGRGIEGAKSPSFVITFILMVSNQHPQLLNLAENFKKISHLQ